jgi:hypothetical protein
MVAPQNATAARERLSVKLKRILALAVIFPALALVACGEDSGASACSRPTGASSPPTINITGEWQGTWKSVNEVFGEGDATFTVSQPVEGSSLTGEITFTDYPCFTSEPFSGQISLVGGSNQVSGQLSGNGVLVCISMTVTEEAASAAYVSLIAGDCSNDTGELTLTRD